MMPMIYATLLSLALYFLFGFINYTVLLGLRWLYQSKKVKKTSWYIDYIVEGRSNHELIYIAASFAVCDWLFAGFLLIMNSR